MQIMRTPMPWSRLCVACPYLAVALFSGVAMAENFVRLTETDTVRGMVRHPAFSAFGPHLLPRPEDADNAALLRHVEDCVSTGWSMPGSRQ